MFTIASVKDLGLQFRDNSHRMVGQDGAFTIPLREGLLWFFGDTLIGSRQADESLWYPEGRAVGPDDMSGKAGIERMINNCGLISRDPCGADGVRDYRYILDAQGRIRPLIPLAEDEDPDRVRIWCLHGVQAGETIYLYFIKVETVAEGIFPVNFKIIGSGLAVGDCFDWQFVRLLHQGSDIWWPGHQPHFASAVLNTEQDYIYCYGVLQGDDKVQRCYLARVRKEEIARRDGYAYLCAPLPQWSPNIEDAMPIFSGMPNEQSVSFNVWLGKYLAVHSLDLSGKIVARTADHPWGPWSDAIELYQVKKEHPFAQRYPQLIYAGKEHPALARENGRIIYVTYIEFEEYYPHLLEITLTRLSE